MLRARRRSAQFFVVSMLLAANRNASGGDQSSNGTCRSSTADHPEATHFFSTADLATVVLHAVIGGVACLLHRLLYPLPRPT